MKQLFYILSVFSLVLLSSCEDFIDVNENPNNPTISSPAILLPSIQARLSYTMGGDASRYTGIFTQHIDGISRQFIPYQNYSFANGDFDTMWGNLYSGVLSDIYELKDIAVANNNTHYLAVSQILESYTMLLLTDLFGDVPYSEFKTGTTQPVTQPVYDSQASILAALLTLLSDAKTALSTADTSGNVPGNQDLIYAGDVTKWIQFANAIEARIHLRNKQYPQALTAANNSYQAINDEASFQYASGSTTAAPWFQYIEQRDDIEVGANYTALLSSLSDPRSSTYGALLDLTHPVFTDDQDLAYLSYEEVKFVQAECVFRASGSAAAEPFYEAAIRASLEKLGYDTPVADAYYASVSGATLDKIMTQKYLALYTDVETFADWRRTNIPSLSPNTGSQIPRRLLYPQSELNFNSSNTPSGVTLFQRVGWDN